ncbi:MAG: transmembrane anchor protein [Rhodocyclaceae bacterium]|nr:transmembrane anchor protein [Rhodocyclaceae bacterium]
MYNTDLPTRAELPSAGKLLRSTVLAAAIAAGLLVTTILPAEYNVDPTGIGRALGLTQMGEIKLALAAEASAAASPKAQEAAPEPLVEAATSSPPVQAGPARSHGGGLAHSHAATNASDAAASPGSDASVPDLQQHTVTIRLKNGEAAEIKLSMNKGSAVEYEWSAGGPVNYDMHGDPTGAPADAYHGYGKARNKMGDAGTLTAAFDGKHGWYWRNRSGEEISVTLKTKGDYGQIQRVL